MMKKKHSNMTTKKGIVIFAALFIIFYALIYVVPTVSDIFTQTYIAEYGTLDVSRDAKCIIVRNEKAYTANSAGKVEREAEAGELLKAHRQIVSLGGNALYSNEIGVVSYYYDGFEQKCSGETLDSISKEFFNTFKDSAGVQKAVSGKAEAGNTVFKIIDNTKWYLVCWLDAEDEEVFTEGRNVTVTFDEENQILMEVEKVTKQGKEIKVVLSTNRIYKDFDKYRVKECTITAKSSNGIIVNTDSIVEKDGVDGVYIVDKYGKENFVPVLIYSSHGGKTVVAKNYYYDSEGYPVETIKNYDEVLKNGK